MRRDLRIAAVMGIVGLLSLAQSALAETPRPAQEIMSEALKTARAKHKPVFVLFDASW
jgi:hypothetical protein